MPKATATNWNVLHRSIIGLLLAAVSGPAFAPLLSGQYVMDKLRELEKRIVALEERRR